MNNNPPPLFLPNYPVMGDSWLSLDQFKILAKYGSPVDLMLGNDRFFHKYAPHTVAHIRKHAFSFELNKEKTRFTHTFDRWYDSVLACLDQDKLAISPLFVHSFTTEKTYYDDTEDHPFLQPYPCLHHGRFGGVDPLYHCRCSHIFTCLEFRRWLTGSLITEFKGMTYELWMHPPLDNIKFSHVENSHRFTLQVKYKQFHTRTLYINVHIPPHYEPHLRRRGVKGVPFFVSAKIVYLQGHDIVSQPYRAMKMFFQERNQAYSLWWKNVRLSWIRQAKYDKTKKRSTRHTNHLEKANMHPLYDYNVMFLVLSFLPRVGQPAHGCN